MALNFPINPEIGDIFPIGAVKQWQWNGQTWDLLSVTDPKCSEQKTW